MLDTPKMDAARDAVIASIAAAFDGVGRGEGITLHEATAIDYCASDKTRRKTRRLDTESRWQDVPDAAIESNPSALSFFDAAGFRYYIPAFMIYAVRNYCLTSAVSADFSLYTFQNEPNDTRRFGLLDDAQRRAICQFIRFCDLVERDIETWGHPSWGESEVTLRFGWGRYCESD